MKGAFFFRAASSPFSSTTRMFLGCLPMRIGLFFFLPPEILAWLQMHSGTHRQTHQLTQDLDLPFRSCGKSHRSG